MEKTIIMLCPITQHTPCSLITPSGEWHWIKPDGTLEVPISQSTWFLTRGFSILKEKEK